MFQFIPLLGAQSDSHARQSLLDFGDGLKVLVDIGWDESFDVELLKEVTRVAPQLSLILLTHATISHIGAYAHCCKHVPHFTSIPVYSTFPISALGRLLLQDLYSSNPKATPHLPRPPTSSTSDSRTTEYSADWLYAPPTNAEINSYFASINLLKFSQPHHPLPVHYPNLSITAYSAGHTLGGTIWKIQSNQENIVYAVDWNHSRENHLSGAAFLPPGTTGGVSVETLGRPTALICSARTTDDDLAMGGKFSGGGGRKKRDDALLETIRNFALKQGKTVLIPTDSTARVLELSYLLEHAFRKDASLRGESSKRVGLYLLGKKARRIAGVVGSMLEWMDEGVVKAMEAAGAAAITDNPPGKRGNRGRKGQQQGQQKKQVGPFDFLHLKILDKRAQIDRILPIAEYESSIENDGSDSDMIDYDPETGGLIERKKPKGRQAQHKKTKQKAPLHHGMVILAPDTSLEWGFAREAFTRIANEDGNVIILTEVFDRRGSLAHELGAVWRTEIQKKTLQQKNDVSSLGISLNWERQFQVFARTALSPTEIENYQKYLQVISSTKSLLPTKKTSASPLDLLAAVGNSDDEDEDATSESESDSDSEKQGKSLATTGAKSKKALAAAAIKAAVAQAASQDNKEGGEEKTEIPFLPATMQDLGISVLLRGRGVFDFDVRGAKGRNRMFPVVLRRKRGDEYGETVKTEDYLRAEEKDESPSLHAAGSGENEKRQFERVMGRKRKWEEAGMIGIVKAKGSDPAFDKSKQSAKSERHKRRKGGKNKGGRDEEGESKDAEMSGSAEGSDFTSGSDSETDSENELGDDHSTPSKLTIKTTIVVKIRCKIHYIDYAGLHDGRSLRMLLPLINPRKLILIGGMGNQVEKLAKDCQDLLSPQNSQMLKTGQMRGADIFTPADGDVVNASVDTNAWVVKLSERLVKGLKWQEVAGLGVVHIIGRVLPSSPEIASLALEESNKKRKMIEVCKDNENRNQIDGMIAKKPQKDTLDSEGDTTMSGTATTATVDESSCPSRMLDVLQPAAPSGTGVMKRPSSPPPASSSTNLSLLRTLKAKPIHVGDIKLIDLRRVLTSTGHVAEFAGEGGLLVVDGVVVVKKVGVGRLVIEDGGGGLFVGAQGPASRAGAGRTFVEVRKRVYEGLAVVAGSA